MRKVKITYKTISPVILTSRTESALYRGVDFGNGNDNVKIIYPFYSHCNRNLQGSKEFKKADSYYIPASSLKGALLGSLHSDTTKGLKKTSEIETEKLQEEEIKFRSQMRFRDIKVHPKDIQLSNVEKVQYLYQEDDIKSAADNPTERVYKSPIWDVFFPAIQLEMLKTGVILEGEILFKAEESDFNKALARNFKMTKEKMANYIAEIEKRIEKIGTWKVNNNKIVEDLTGIKKALQYLLSREKLIFIGGYKGILASLTKIEKGQKEEFKNGFYIDKATKLPYGLVEVNYIY